MDYIAQFRVKAAMNFSLNYNNIRTNLALDIVIYCLQMCVTFIVLGSSGVFMSSRINFETLKLLNEMIRTCFNCCYISLSLCNVSFWICQCQCFLLMNGECYTAIFYTDQTFNEITALLEQEYTFLPNKLNNGKEANFLLYDQTVIVTLYKNKKMQIEGTGRKIWRNSVYRMLTDKLTPRHALSIKTV